MLIAIRASTISIMAVHTMGVIMILSSLRENDLSVPPFQDLLATVMSPAASRVRLGCLLFSNPAYTAQ